MNTAFQLAILFLWAINDHICEEYLFFTVIKKYACVDLHSADHSCRLCNECRAETVPRRAM